MAPKTRKSVSAWNLCEKCKVVVTHKDLATHAEDSCPPSTSSWTHGYIKDGVLYGILEEMKHQDGMKNVPKSMCDDFVLVSLSALQLCHIPIGDPVVVSICGVSTVKTAWPTEEKSLVSVLMTGRAIELHWHSGCDTHVTVRKLKTEAFPAGQVYVELVEQVDIPHLPALLTGKYRDKILKTGDKLHLQHYGKPVFFNVSEILPYKVTYFCESDELTKDLEKLAIETNESSDEDGEYYRIVEETIWNIKMAKSAIDEENNTDRSSHRLSAVGGLSKVIEDVSEVIEIALRKTPLIPGLPVIRGILLFGVAGTGKSMLAEALAAERKVNVVRVYGAEIYSKFLGETEARLRELFKNAEQKAPSIILMDEVDALCPKRGSDGSGGSEQDRRVVATLLTLLDSLHHSSVVSQKAILVIATTSKPDAIDPALRRPGRLDLEIEISVPSPEARIEILQKLLDGIQHQVTEEELKSVAFSAHGFVGADLRSLCSCAFKQAVKRASTVTLDDFAWALTQVKPSAMREILIDVPNVRWSDIGGQHDLKLKLQQMVDWPLNHPEVFVRFAISSPKGILMYGPPGCSKTMIAKALATESKLNFISIKGPELFSKWVGESEKAVREVFHKARQVAPAIVFFDEIDALCGERSGGGDSSGSNVHDRVLAQFLTELDGVEPLGNVVVVGATNRPDRIDKALLRPGRLDRVVYVPLPDADTRREILEIKLRKMAAACDVDIGELVSKTEGYSGAEVLQVCHEAAEIALVEDLNVKCLSQSHFNRALQEVTPRTSESQLQLYETFQQR